MGRPAFDESRSATNSPPRPTRSRGSTSSATPAPAATSTSIHWNQRIATSVGLPDVIAHGMLTMATAARLVTDWAGDPGAVVEYGVRFTKPVVVPDDDSGALLEVAGVVAAKDEQARSVRVDLTATSGGDKVLGRAQAVVRLP